MRFFYNTTTKDSICDDVDFLCGSTSATYPLQQKQRNFNQHYFNVVRMIWESQDRWQYDDSNYLSAARAKTTLVHKQADYTLPSIAQRIRRVQVRASTGNWTKLFSRDEMDEDFALETLSAASLPLMYDLVGRSIILTPSPASASVILSAGLEVNFDRTPSAFGSASTASPSIPEPFHRILSYGMSIDFTQDNSQKQLWLREKTDLEQGLKNFYSHRNVEERNQVKIHSKRLWRRYR